MKGWRIAMSAVPLVVRASQDGVEACDRRAQVFERSEIFTQHF